MADIPISPSRKQGIGMSVLDYAEALANEGENIFADAMSTVLTAARKDLREAAFLSPEWVSLAEFLDIEVTPDTVDVVFTGPSFSDHASFTELEYGSPEQAPHPLIRTFAADLTRKAPTAVEALLKREL